MLMGIIAINKTIVEFKFPLRIISTPRVTFGIFRGSYSIEQKNKIYVK